MKFVETIRNIWKIDDLRQRILTTLWLIVLYRLGTTIVLPGIDPSTLTALHDQTRGGLMALLDMFSGGAFSNASVFGLGIMPYISASIVVQLMAMVVPSIQKMQREGESGRRKLGQWTRYLTIIILLILNAGQIMNLGFDKVYLMQNQLNVQVSEIIATYTYKVGLLDLDFSYSTAIGLLNSVVNVILLFSVNLFSRKISENSLW